MIIIIIIIVQITIKVKIITINNNDNNNYHDTNVLISARNLLYNLPTQQHLYSDAPPQSLHPYTAWFKKLVPPNDYKKKLNKQNKQKDKQNE